MRAGISFVATLEKFWAWLNLKNSFVSGYSYSEIQSSLRDLDLFGFYPTLKRWTIFGSPFGPWAKGFSRRSGSDLEWERKLRTSFSKNWR